MRLHLKKIVRNKILKAAALIAIMLNALLPFYAISSLASVQAAENNEYSLTFGEKILICTDGGFKWVTKEELQDIDTTFDYGSHLKCPLCYVLAHGQSNLLPADEQAAIYVPTRAAAPKAISSFDLTISEIVLLGRFSRAPPVISKI